MERKIWLVGEKLKMLEVLVFEKVDKLCEREESREKEWEAMRKDLTELKRKDFEKDKLLGKLKEKIASLEGADREEKNEIWSELEEWNAEWERGKMREREAKEQKKTERFNRRREEELWEGKLKNMEEILNPVRRRIKINEEEMVRFIKEAGKALMDVRRELDSLKKQREGDGSNSEEEVTEVCELGKGMKQKVVTEELGETMNKLKIKGAGKLAVAWKKSDEGEGEEEEEAKKD